MTRSKQYHDRKKNGICVRCGIRKATKKRYCKYCYAKRIKYDKSRYYRLVNSNICYRCGKRQSQKYSSLCRNCFFKYMASRVCGNSSKGVELEQKFKQQNGRCAYSGVKLFPGKNTSVDHIVPKTHGGTNRMSNLQWVDRSVNNMKSNMSHKSFLSLVCKIYKYTFL